MTFDRRTALGGIAASTVALAFPLVSRAQTGGTLDQIKQRGSLRIGVTQAPPWFSKDPKTGSGRPVLVFPWARPWLLRSA